MFQVISKPVVNMHQDFLLV